MTPILNPNRSGRRIFRLPAKLLGLSMAALALAGCSSPTATTGQASSPVHDVVEKIGFATTPPEPAGFVKASRTEQTDYLPVGVTPPARSIKPKKPDEVKAMESDLEAVRARTNAKAR